MIGEEDWTPFGKRNVRKGRSKMTLDYIPGGFSKLSAPEKIITRVLPKLDAKIASLRAEEK